MDDFYEAIEPELTDEEIEADHIDHLLQTAPPIDWERYSECDNERQAAARSDSRYCGPSPCARNLAEVGWMRQHPQWNRC